jgi:hypothetical protein
LDPSVWHDQATVQLNHRVYNAEKACIDNQNPPPSNPLDQQGIDHTAYGDANCPPDTWHWDNVSIQPAIGYSIIQSVPQQTASHSTSPTRIQFAAPAPDGAMLQFVAFSHTPDLRVSFDGGTSWQVPRVQPANAPNNGASEENGEAFFTPIPAGVQSIMVRGSNGFWGSFNAEDFTIVGPPNGAAPLPTAVPTATSGPATNTPTTVSTATSVPTTVASATVTLVPTATPLPSTATVTATATVVATLTPTPTATITPAPTTIGTPVPTAEVTPQATAGASGLTPQATATPDNQSCVLDIADNGTVSGLCN